MSSQFDDVKTRMTRGLVGEGDIFCSQDYKDIAWLIAEVERLRAVVEARGPYCAQHGEHQPCSQHRWVRSHE